MINQNGVVVTAEILADILSDRLSCFCDQHLPSTLWDEAAEEILMDLEAL